jgi:hypothetical protein
MIPQGRFRLVAARSPDGPGLTLAFPDATSASIPRSSRAILRHRSALWRLRSIPKKKYHDEPGHLLPGRRALYANGPLSRRLSLRTSHRPAPAWRSTFTASTCVCLLADRAAPPCWSSSIALANGISMLRGRHLPRRRLLPWCAAPLQGGSQLIPAVGPLSLFLKDEWSSASSRAQPACVAGGPHVASAVGRARHYVGDSRSERRIRSAVELHSPE